MIRAFRIVQTSLLRRAFTGEGARIDGGRWNSPGTAMVYCAESLSLATLEIMAHAGDHFLRGNPYSHVSLDIPEECVLACSSDTLPRGWDSPVAGDASKYFGDQWVAQGKSAVLRVPSVVTKTESNYLLNPAHPDFKKLLIGKPERFFLDPRLKKK